MKIIIKKNNKDISIVYPNINKFGEGKRSVSECKGIPEGSDWFIYDGIIDKSDLESREQLYWEDVDGKTEIKKDLNWEVKLMSDQVVKKKHLNRIRKELDGELEKETPDPITVSKLQRSLDKHKEIKAGPHNEDETWTTIAIQNLDKRVSKGESDKPIIRQKLQDKLNELKNK